VVDLETQVRELGRWDSRFAYSVNDHGVIVVGGRLAGKQHGFMLVPLPAR